MGSWSPKCEVLGVSRRDPIQLLTERVGGGLGLGWGGRWGTEGGARGALGGRLLALGLIEC